MCIVQNSKGKSWVHAGKNESLIRISSLPGPFSTVTRFCQRQSMHVQDCRWRVYIALPLFKPSDNSTPHTMFAFALEISWPFNSS